MTTPVSATGGTPVPSGVSPTNAAFGKDTFMKLLVAQLKYQNPESATDSSQYMSQMAMFTQVEKLTDLVTAQQQSQVLTQRLSAEGLVGRQVTGAATDSTRHTATVTSVTFGAGDPTLGLSDGSSMSLDAVNTVELAPQ